MKSVYSLRLLALGALLGLAGCGGGSSDNATAETYLQFYNGAATAGNTSLKAGDKAIGTATYGDVSALVAVAPDSYTLELSDVASADKLLSKEMPLAEGNKTLFILTQKDGQFDYLSLSFKRDESLDKQFKLHLANLSAQHPTLDVHLSAESKGFADAELVDSLSFQEVSSVANGKELGKFNVYLTQAGGNTPLFVAKGVNFAYTSNYVLIIRDKFGPLAGQLSVDVILNSSTVAAYDHTDASAQFRLYNSLEQDINVALDNQNVASVATGQLSGYLPLVKGDYSLSVRDSGGAFIIKQCVIKCGRG